MRHHHAAKALALTLLLCALLLLGCEARETRPRAALLLPEAEGHHWENLREGAEAAAERLNVELTCYAPDEEAGLDAEDLPALAQADGAQVLIAAGPGDRRWREALSTFVLPLVAVGLETEKADAAVHNDDAKMGRSAAQALAAHLEAGDCVLLLTDSAEFHPEENVREDALRKALEERGVTVRGRLFSGDNLEWAYRQTLQQLYLWPELDAVVAFSAKATVGAALAVEYLGRDVIIVGTDIVPGLIACIEDGTVDATIVRNAFGMGYLGVERALEITSGADYPPEQTLSAVAVTRDNLFTPEIEKIVFSFDEE